MSAARKRLVIAITGATGAVYGVRALQRLRALGTVETHLVVSDAGWLSLRHELDMKKSDIAPLADVLHSARDVGASIASGSFATEGMIVAPCSVKTLAGIAHAFSDSLVIRAADVALKERRRLVLMVREAPLSLAHIRNMAAVTEMGGIIYPPVPAFYQRPASVEQLVEHTIERVLDLFQLGAPMAAEWPGTR